MLVFLRVVAMVGLAASLLAVAQADTIYKWVDDDGVTHYAQHPPAGLSRDRFETIGRETTPWPEEEQAEDDEQTAATEVEEDDGPSSIEEFCDQIRHQLDVLQTVDDVRIETEDGELRRLDDSDRQQRQETLEAQIQHNC